MEFGRQNPDQTIVLAIALPQSDRREISDTRGDWHFKLSHHLVKDAGMIFVNVCGLEATGIPPLVPPLVRGVRGDLVGTGRSRKPALRSARIPHLKVTKPSEVA